MIELVKTQVRIGLRAFRLEFKAPIGFVDMFVYIFSGRVSRGIIPSFKKTFFSKEELL